MESWQEKDGALVKTFTFPTFRDAVRFIDAVADVAEREQHHPTIFNSYTTVTLSLSTHDQGDILTDKDRALARAIDALTV